MRGIRCWGLLADGTRCGCQVLPGHHFCAQHARLGCHHNPSLVFLAPVAEMPPELVDRLRVAAPETVFPEAELPIEPDPPVAPDENGSRQRSHVQAPAGPGVCTFPLAITYAADSPAGEPVASPAQPRSDDQLSEHELTSLVWMLDLLRGVMTEVAAADDPPLKKANAVTRLGNLCVKVSGVVEQNRINSRLQGESADQNRFPPQIETSLGGAPEACARHHGARQAHSEALGGNGPSEAASRSQTRARNGINGDNGHPGEATTRGSTSPKPLISSKAQRRRR